MAGPDSEQFFWTESAWGITLQETVQVWRRSLAPRCSPMKRRRWDVLLTGLAWLLTCRVLAGPPSGGGLRARTDRFGDPLPVGAVFRIGTLRLRYFGDLYHLAFSPDGKYVVSSSENERKVRLWDRVTGREVIAVPTYVTFPFFAFSPDGRTLAVNGAGGHCFCDPTTGKIRRQVSENFSCFGFSGDGRTLFAFDHFRICRWDVATGKKLGEWPTDQQQTRDVAFCPHGRLVAHFSGPEDQIRVWDVRTGARLCTWKVRDERHIYCLAFSPDGKKLAVGCNDGFLRLYMARTGKELRRGQVPGAREVETVAFAPVGGLLGTVDDGNVLRLWNWKTAQQLRQISGVTGPVAFSHDGKMLATGDPDCRIRLWDVATGRDLCPALASTGWITGAVFSPDGRLLASGSDRNVLRLFDPTTGKEWQRLPGYRPFVFSPDSRRLWLLRREGPGQGWQVGLYNLATGKEQVRLAGADQDDFLGACSPDGKLLITWKGNDFGAARTWDATTGKKLLEVAARSRNNEPGLTCSPDGRSFALFQFGENAVRLVTAATGRELRRLSGVSRTIRVRIRRVTAKGIAKSEGDTECRPTFSPDGKKLLTGGPRDCMLLWDLPTGKVRLRLPGNEFTPEQAVFSSEGNRLALMDCHGILCIMDAATGQVFRRLATRQNNLDLIATEQWAFSPDGRMLAVTYGDGKLIIHEVLTGQPIVSWSSPDRGEVIDMIFSPDCTRLVTRGTHGTALVWDTTGRFGKAERTKTVLSAPELDAAWADLAGRDAARAYRAIGRLVPSPASAVPFLAQRLRPVPAPNPMRLRRLVADLKDKHFAVRRKAARTLEKLGDVALPELRRAIAGRTDLEQRRRVEKLLARIRPGAEGPEQLRAARAVCALEKIGDRAACRVLQGLAAGAPIARLTQEAKASLARLHDQLAIKP
jgi:WD40 repeat protein